jgi:CRISPR system Cascade subunit CasB
MSETQTRQPTTIERFLAHLASQVNDRGMMADLRHGLSEATEYRTWPHVAPWCRLDHERERRIWLTVAAGFALHQRTADSGNMGTVMRALATGGGRGREGLSTFDARFRRLLACSSSTEVCKHLAGVLRAAEREGVAINFVRLFGDLTHWGDRTRVEWATEYWGGAPNASEDDTADEVEHDGEGAAGGEEEP